MPASRARICAFWTWLGLKSTPKKRPAGFAAACSAVVNPWPQPSSY
jgi:hypothetical protein